MSLDHPDVKKFSHEDIKLLMLRCQQGAPDKVIATELSYTSQKEFKPEEVAAARDILKLPSEDPARARIAAIQESSKPSSDNVVLSASSARLPKKRKTVASQNFGAAAEPAAPDPLIQALEKMLSEKRTIAKIAEPATVMAPVSGRHYVMPGVGVMLCEGTDTMVVAGHKLETARLSGLFTAVRLNPPLTKLKERNLREVASAETVDELFYKLRHGESTLKAQPKTSDQKMKFYDATKKSGSLEQIASLVCLAFGRNRPREPGSMLIDAGNASIDLLAQEISVAKAIDLKDARRMVSVAVQKESLDEINKRYSSRNFTPHRPEGTEPA